MSGGRNSITLKADLTGLRQILDTLATDIQEAVRPASQAAAQVFYDEVKKNVSRIGKKSGNLDNSIYQVYSKANSNPYRAVYHISWNAKTAPHAGWLEYGHIVRYMSFKNKQGEWKTKIRPENVGKPKPPEGASRAVLDAYYMPRPDGPYHVMGRSFMRSAIDKTPQALAAAEAAIYKVLKEKTGYER